MSNEVRQEKIRDAIRAACRMEVLCPKPGNVCPGLEFDDATVDDFLRSADAIARPLTRGASIGQAILEAVAATREAVGHNTNMGIVLLLSPLAAAAAECSQPADLPDRVRDVLQAATVEDSRDVYAAIRIASPAGLGEQPDQDIAHEPTLSLIECMRLAADRDRIARQYVTGFEDVLNSGRKWLNEIRGAGRLESQHVTHLAVRLLAGFGDSLIARKCGVPESDRVQRQAGELLRTGWPAAPGSDILYQQFDRSLRSDGHRLNPGTTADLVAAILFVELLGPCFS
jgi:triphosphoribosyl-dephospho-CoA synthase